MTNQIIRTTPTASNPDGIDFVPKQLAIDVGIGGRSGIGTGSDGTTIAGSIIAFIKGATLETAERGEGYYNYSAMLNAQKLALDPSSPINTRVYVTDWVAAGLTGPKQKLSAPNLTHAGIAILGTPFGSGIYTKRGTFGGKNYYNRLDSPNDTTNGTSIYVVEWNNARWEVYDDGGIATFYSTSAVLTPNLATNWKRVDDNSDAGITVTEVLQRDLDAGVTLAGAGDNTQNGSYPQSGISEARLTYTNGGKTIHLTRFSNGWELDNGSYNAGGFDGAFPFQAAWVVNSANPPPPIVSRNDVASEANWQTVV